VSEQAGYPEASIWFVIAVVRYAAQYTNRDRAQSLRARDICSALREYSLWNSGGENEAIIELAQKKIRFSEDVGSIVFGLVEAGLFSASESDSQSDFDGLFTLENLFDVEI
jgi:uncharacterized repeat protein (TIGR04138 family)